MSYAERSRRRLKSVAAKRTDATGAIRPNRFRAFLDPFGARLAIWLLVTLFVTLALSWGLLFIDRPERNFESPVSSLPDALGSYFSVGFDSPDTTGAMRLEKDDAIRLTWQRTGEKRGMSATLEVGPYEVLNSSAPTKLIFMVPAAAKVVACQGLNFEQKEAVAEQVSFVGYRPLQCEISAAQFSRFITAPLFPSALSSSNGSRLQLAITIVWDEPSIYALGAGREHVSLKYQGRFLPLDRAKGYLPADQVKLNYDTTNTSVRSGLPVGVYIRFQLTDPNWHYLDVAPDGHAISSSTRVWVSTPDEPTFMVDLATENTATRRRLDLLTQGVFLVIGAIIGATLPKRRKNS